MSLSMTYVRGETNVQYARRRGINKVANGFPKGRTKGRGPPQEPSKALMAMIGPFLLCMLVAQAVPQYDLA